MYVRVKQEILLLHTGTGLLLTIFEKTPTFRRSSYPLRFANSLRVLGELFSFERKGYVHHSHIQSLPLSPPSETF